MGTRAEDLHDLHDVVERIRREFPDDRAHQLVESILRIQEHLAATADALGVTLADLEQSLPRLADLAVRQARHSSASREKLLATLSADLDLLDPLPAASVEQARRAAASRNRLVASGAWTYDAIAEAHEIKPSSARGWVKRHRDAGRLVTVVHSDQTFVPAVLLDGTAEPHVGAEEVVGPLVEAGMDGWAVWRWLDAPSGRLDGLRPADLLSEGDISRAARAARSLAANAVSTHAHDVAA